MDAQTTKPNRISIYWEGMPNDDVEDALTEAMKDLGYVGPDSGYGFGQRDLEFFLPEWLERMKNGEI